MGKLLLAFVTHAEGQRTLHAMKSLHKRPRSQLHYSLIANAPSKPLRVKRKPLTILRHATASLPSFNCLHFVYLHAKQAKACYCPADGDEALCQQRPKQA